MRWAVRLEKRISVGFSGKILSWVHTLDVSHDSNQPGELTPLRPEQQEEFVRLLNEAHSLLLRYIMSFLANRHDAEDVLQASQHNDVAPVRNVHGRVGFHCLGHHDSFLRGSQFSVHYGAFAIDI